jgi:DNA-binding NarL/FixJ family response regulator
LGYVLKNATSRELVAAIRTVHDGRQYIAEELKAAFELERTGEGPPGDVLRVLTDRQIQVLQRLAAGRTNREIASALGLSIKTVNAHRSNILTKLQLRNNADLTRFAIRSQLLEVE